MATGARNGAASSMPPSATMATDPEQQQPARPRTGRWDRLGLFGGSALLVLAAFWVAGQFVQPAPPNHITIAAGQPGGSYFHYAQEYRDQLAKHDIELEVLETDGTVDNLGRILSDEDPVDLALVQGGIATDEQRAAISGLGSMFYEPLWLLAPVGQPTLTLGELEGLRVAIGPRGSGTRRLALRLLSLNDVAPSEALLASPSTAQAVEDLANGELDLVLAVSAPDSPLLAKVIDNPRIGFQHLPRAAAYARIDRALSVLELPRGTLSLPRDLPPQDLELLVATANLVAHPDIHPALVDLLIQAASAVHGSGSVLASPGTFPTPRQTDFPLNADAQRHYEDGPPFLQRFLPFWLATWIDRTKVMLLPLLALLLPLMKVLPPVYVWRVRRRILRWYVELRRIDLEIETGAPDDARQRELARQLAAIESDAAQIDVPLGYTDQLYNLRLHIRLLQQHLERVGTGAATQ